jgi:hypothetical protein
MAHVDYQLLAKAYRAYQHMGFTYVEVPWVVSEDGVTKTLPSDRLADPLDDKYLVGSAEQSLVELMAQGIKLPNYCFAITPCFRQEPVLDETHQRYFMKLELFCPFSGKAIMLRKCASIFMRQIGADPAIDGEDLLVNGIEVGSYYNRENYSCGTGIALPRFSVALRKGNWL